MLETIYANGEFIKVPVTCDSCTGGKGCPKRVFGLRTARPKDCPRMPKPEKKKEKSKYTVKC